MMKAIRFFLFFALTIPFFSAAQQPPALAITPIAGDYYVYTTYGTLDDGSRFPSNSMYVVTQKGVIMIDVPWDTTQTLPLLDSIEKRHHKKVIACISTHFHKDRTANLNVLKSKGIHTYATAQTIQWCRERKEEIPEFAMNKDTVFNLGNHLVQTYYPGKGHTPDNIVVWFPDAKILYGGCFVKSVDAATLGNLEDAHPEEWSQSMNKVMTKFKSPAYIIPGHEQWKSRQSLNHTLELLRQYKAKKK